MVMRGSDISVSAGAQNHAVLLAQAGLSSYAERTHGAYPSKLGSRFHCSIVGLKASSAVEATGGIHTSFQLVHSPFGDGSSNHFEVLMSSSSFRMVMADLMSLLRSQ